jgi:hypothetical protein
MFIKEKLACLLILTIFAIKYSSQMIIKEDNQNSTKPLKVTKCKSSNDCGEDELCYIAIGLCICSCKFTNENCKCDDKSNKLVIDLVIIKSLNSNISTPTTIDYNTDSKLKTSKSKSATIKKIEFTNTLFTVGFGFGLPILLACLIIVFFVYFLRKTYLLEINHHHLYPSFATNLNHEYSLTNQNRIETNISGERSNNLLNFSSAIQINNQFIERENPVVDSLLNENEVANEKQDDDEDKKPPVYEEISIFSHPDKLPTYSSFRRKSKSKVLL